MEDDAPRGNWGFIRIVVPIVVVAGIGTAIAFAVHDSAGVRREAPRVETLVTVMPPPPPPPKEPPPELERKEQEVVKTVEQPRPDATPRQITINGPAQAGGDAFNIGAGSGGGMVASGSDFENASYGRYLGAVFQQAIQEDETVSRLVFTAEVAVWLDGHGRVARVQIWRSSGDLRTDQSLIVAFHRMPAVDQPPPPGFGFPQRIRVTGRRAG
ncbi:MAG TPA: hypothetical protein VMU01_10290 [Rhizomicrobium sp.]|nr:hypothetical protein [Rhizomicrobium sp.]